MACPHVSGVVALIIAHGITDPTSVVAVLEDSATDLGLLAMTMSLAMD